MAGHHQKIPEIFRMEGGLWNTTRDFIGLGQTSMLGSLRNILVNTILYLSMQLFLSTFCLCVLFRINWTLAKN